MVIAAIPIKPFGVAKARLAPVVGPEDRSRLGRAVAARTATLAVEAGAEVVIVVADDGVASWAKSQDFGVIREDPELGEGLNGAARTAARHADLLGLRWAIIHADLPVVTSGDLRVVFGIAEERSLIVPSHNGGTNIIAGGGAAFPFSYGAGSFHRHLAAMPDATVVATPRLSLDLDTPVDLARARASRAGGWLGGVLGDRPGTG
jgi:2-phospho-L-lactate guanylyltransferase